MEALAATGGLAPAALHSQLAAAVQIVLHMRRLRGGARVLDTVGVLSRDGSGVAVRTAWTRTDGPADAHRALDELLVERGVRGPW